PASKRKDHANDEERAIAAETGQGAMVLLCDELMSSLGRMSQSQFRNAAAVALGIDPVPDPDLFVLTVSAGQATVRPAPDGVPLGHLSARRASDVRIVVHCDGTPLFSWQVNCTNGI